MTTQKLIVYNIYNENGEIFDKYSIYLKLSEYVGNYLIHRNILRHYVLNRQGTVSTKTKSEVRGGGRKPWKQKGTGSARAGSNRSPLWKGGGVIFGPKPKKRHFKLNKKERNLALQTLLVNKRKKTFLLPNNLETVNRNNTKDLLHFIKMLKVSTKESILIIVSAKTNSLILATRNVQNITLISAANLDIFSLLKTKNILMTFSALKTIKKMYCD